jgi:hypothetical protein
MQLVEQDLRRMYVPYSCIIVKHNEFAKLFVNIYDITWFCLNQVHDRNQNCSTELITLPCQYCISAGVIIAVLFLYCLEFIISAGCIYV